MHFKENSINCMIDVYHIDGLVQDCIISSANTLEILQSCTKPSICHLQLAAMFVQVSRCQIFWSEQLSGIVCMEFIPVMLKDVGLVYGSCHVTCTGTES